MPVALRRRHPLSPAVHGPSFPVAARRWRGVRVRVRANRVQPRAHESRYLHTQPPCQQKPHDARCFSQAAARGARAHRVAASGRRRRGESSARPTARRGAPLELVPSGRPVRAGDGGAGHLVGTRRRRRNRRPARAAGRGGARRRRGGAGGGREREAPPVPGGTGGARAGAAVRRQRAAIGGTGRCSRPVYQESGRISRLSAACSITCAAQPVMREETKIGVKRGMSKPMR